VLKAVVRSLRASGGFMGLELGFRRRLVTGLGISVGLACVIAFGAFGAACGNSPEAPPGGGNPDGSAPPVGNTDGGGISLDGSKPTPGNHDSGKSDTGTTPPADTGGVDATPNPPPPQQDLVKYVDPLIGTGLALTSGGAIGGGQGGSVFPGADVPFGMVQFSPDTPNGQPSGYLYHDDKINSFSLTHFSGAGCPNNGDVQILPIVSSGQTQVTYADADEHAQAGYYSVTTGDGVLVELTATPRAGIGRFTFPSSGGTLVVDASKNDVFTPTASITTSGKTLDGTTQSGNFCGTTNNTKLYFHAEFDQPFTVTTPSAGKVLLAFAGAGPVTMSVAISYVSGANAQANFTAEVGTNGFDALKTAAQASWNTKLNAIQVTGANDTEKTKLYTALYHSLLHPNVFNDVTGDYIGFDGMTHQVMPGHNQYANYSGWDIYRSQVQLVAYLYPDVSSDMLQSLVNNAGSCGYFVMWSQNNADDRVMEGDPGALIMANAYAFGATGFDQKTTLKILTNPPSANYSCSWPYLFAPDSPYLGHGYLTQGSYPGASSSTLEIMNRDYAVAQFAKAQGDLAHAKVYLGRAGMWKYLYTPYQSAGGGAPGPISLQARDGNGNWIMPMMAPQDEANTIEGSSEQYLWLVPYAVPDLVNLLGGQAAFQARLDTFFTQLNAGQSSPYAYMGNEPCLESPYEYNWAGAPAHTQDVVNRIVENTFGTDPNTGLPGNDDLGAMSSWLVWSMLGIYPEIPGVGGWALTSPIFDSALVYSTNGSSLQITATNEPGHYIQSATLNGAPLTTPWLDLPAPNTTTTIAYTLGTTPSSWGSGAANAPFNPYPSTAPDLPSAANNQGIIDTSAANDSDLDGTGFALSQQALATAGLTGGGTYTTDGLTFTWPMSGVDNVIPVGQTITFATPITATKIGFLATSTNGVAHGTFTVTAVGGATTQYQVTVDDWALGGTTPPAPVTAPNKVAATAPRYNVVAGKADTLNVNVFYVPIALSGSTQIQSITLPSQFPGTAMMHLFAFASE
jgi:predicted alpha-1,2-mannosidase